LETWNFTWYEDLFAQDAHSPSVVRVTSKAYRRVALYEPGEYIATLTYYNGTKTVANWVVRPLSTQKKAKNVILFIGDGMTTNMITAARLIAHKSINGKYQTKMQMDQFPVLGHQMARSSGSGRVSQANLLFRRIPSTATSLILPTAHPHCTPATRVPSMPWVCMLIPVPILSMTPKLRQSSSFSLESGEVQLVLSALPSSRMQLQLL
jgi:hypothetical protein